MQESTVSDTRICSKCAMSKPLSEFHKDSQGPDGHRTSCKACRSLHMKSHYLAHAELIKSRMTEYRAANPEITAAMEARRYVKHKEKRVLLAIDAVHVRRARILGSRHDEGITVPRLRERDGDACCYCGVTMLFIRAAVGRYDPLKATLEHVAPISRGGLHVWENMKLACRRCNVSKQAKTVEEWLGSAKGVKTWRSKSAEPSRPTADI